MRNSEPKGIIIIGSGGHAGVVLNCLQGAPVLGLLDDFQRPQAICHGHAVLGKIAFKRGWEEVLFHIAIGDSIARQQAFDKMQLSPKRFLNIMHPAACVSKSARLGHGTFFGPFSNVGPDSYIGDHCIINTHANLEHDGHLGSYSHLAPGVMTGGHVTIGEHSLIGVGASIKDRVKIGHRVTVGCGSVVVKDIVDDQSGYGVPWEAKIFAT